MAQKVPFSYHGIAEDVSCRETTFERREVSYYMKCDRFTKTGSGKAKHKEADSETVVAALSAP